MSKAAARGHLQVKGTSRKSRHFGEQVSTFRCVIPQRRLHVRLLENLFAPKFVDLIIYTLVHEIKSSNFKLNFWNRSQIIVVEYLIVK